MNSNSIGSRIKKLRKSLGLTQKQVAKKTGLTPSSITQWELDITKPTGENLYALCVALQTVPGWLLFGKDDAKATPNAEWAGEVKPWENGTRLDDDEVELPFFTEVSLSAGEGSCAVQENHGQKLRFSRSALRKSGVDAGAAACVCVCGTSMEPVLPDGATVGVDTASTAIKEGEMYALDHGGMLRVKLVYRIPGGGLRLGSFNVTEYPDEVYEGGSVKNIRIIGRVFWYSVLR